MLDLSATAQGKLIRDGAATSTEIVERHLTRIAEINPSLNAVVEVLAESARRAALESDARRAACALLSPVDGVPFSIKDSIEVKGTVCTAGTLGCPSLPARRHSGGSTASGGRDPARPHQSSRPAFRLRERQPFSWPHQ